MYERMTFRETLPFFRLRTFISYASKNRSITASGFLQCIYRQGHWHSTETSLLFTSDCILNALDHKETTAVVLFKTSKAFDSISYEIVIIQQDIGLPSSAIRCLNCTRLCA